MKSECNIFTVSVEKEDEGGFSGQCIEIPAAISQGDTMEELRKNMKEAVSLCLECNDGAENQKYLAVTIDIDYP